MAERKVTSTLYLDGAPAEEELNPFAIRLGPAAQRATGRKTTSKRKGDKPRNLSARIKPQAAISAPRQNTPERALSAIGRVSPGAERALRTVDDEVLGLRELYGAGVRGVADVLGGDVYGDGDLQLEDAKTLALAGALGPAFAGAGRLGGAALRRLPVGVRQGASDFAARARRYLTEARPVESSLAARSPVSRDIPRERVFSVTPEETPGASSQHRADITRGSLSARAKYGEAAPWTRLTPEGEAYDVMYAAQNIPQRPAEQAAGAYVNSEGRLEINPVNIFQPEVGDEPAEAMLERIKATENLRGLFDAQEAMAGNMPIADPMGAAPLLRMPSQPDFIRMARSARGMAESEAPYGFTVTSQGGLAFPFGRDLGVAPRDVPETSEMLDRLRSIYPEAEVVPSRNVGFYEPALGTQKGPTAPFSGEATMQTLQNLARAPAETSMGLSSSPEVREAMRAKIARDVGAQGVREDLQNTRRFFADADWQAVVELIRRGVSPAAALAALGYSTASLASDGQ